MPQDSSRRLDGTLKDVGFLGPLRRPDGSVSTELSADAEVDGETLFFPLLVPTLTSSEIASLLSGARPTDEIYRKAISHAQQRKAAGLSPFYSHTESEEQGMAGSKSQEKRSLIQRMKDRNKDLDAATDAAVTPPPKDDADTARRKAGQSTDKNNSGY